MKKRFNIRGETLAETIIALSILAIGITVASTVILNSVRNLAVAKQRVIAINIAREGIEAMRSIRDTNWLLYSDRRRQCWNHDPGAGACNPAAPTPIEPGFYVIYKAADLTWQLEYADENRSSDGDDSDGIFDNDVAMDRIRLSLVDIDLSLDSDGIDADANGDFGNDDTDMYNHLDDDITSPLPYGTLVNNTIYSRYLVVEYLENIPDPNTSPSQDDPPEESINTLDEWNGSTPSELNRMRITSVVQWLRGGISHTVELKTIITDHLGREDLTS